ncbi:MAG TPA: 50S ribosomal protein L11 methyltransferase, partial [Frankiaceae bacterium]|nr:50S ribosomal protein L11 methyltransferase [Frankiaceae bacterium]
MTVTLETVLHRVPELVIEVDTSNTVRLHHEGRVLRLGHDALSLLDVFHRPSTVAGALAGIAPRLRGPRAAQDALATLTMLVNAGVLRDTPVRGFSAAPFPKGGYDAAFVHIAMLDDTVRKGAFLRAVAEVVRPGDVVLDLGTGCGILAVAAARAGARRVYAVEPAGMVHLAERVAERNGVADRVTFLRGWSTQIELPERAHVLTTDIVGNEALDMVVWETVRDARARLLVDDARLVPRGLTAFAHLTRVPDDVLARHRVDAGHLQRWRAAYGSDFTPLRSAHPRRVVSFYERPEVVRRWERLSAPAVLYQVDLADDARRFATT